MSFDIELEKAKTPRAVERLYERHCNQGGAIASIFINYNLTPEWIIRDISKRNPNNWVGRDAQFKLGVEEDTDYGFIVCAILCVLTINFLLLCLF